MEYRYKRDDLQDLDSHGENLIAQLRRQYLDGSEAIKKLLKESYSSEIN